MLLFILEKKAIKSTDYQLFINNYLHINFKIIIFKAKSRNEKK
jgi:hypothetical protein